ncbi:MAG: hypothetical protein U9Q27_03440, partial [Patescibacteria group bacterium]|nr:hypothetical protein [Patescibacteria group bacterium]
MCGIIGLLPFGKLNTEQEKIRQEAMIYLGTELLQLTQTRGKDATGASVMFENGEYVGLKMGISAIEFISRFGKKETDFEGFIKLWRKKGIPAKAFLGHCRKPSTGMSTIDNANNHPIKVGDIIGIHNGTIDNNEIIFKNLKRTPIGNVDSEAIFQLLHYLTNNGTDPFTLDILNETCKRLQGSYACLAFNGNNPFQIVAFRDTRPIEVALVKPLKLAIIASDNNFIKTALFRLNIMANIYNYGVNFPIIHKNDVDMSSLTDDSVFLFDLTKEINMDSSVASVYENRHVNRLEKMWKKKKSVYNDYYNQADIYRNNQEFANNQKRREIDAIPTNRNKFLNNNKNEEPKTDELLDTDKKNFKNVLVWNKFSKNFKKIDVLLPIKKEEINTLSNIIIDIETDEVATIDRKIIRKANNEKIIHKTKKDNKSSDFSIKETLPNLIKENKNPAKIKVVPVNLSNKAQETENEKEEIKKKLISKTQINMSTLPTIAIELAKEVTESAERFSTDNDVCQALDFYNFNNMKNLPIYSLANRIV